MSLAYRRDAGATRADGSKIVHVRGWVCAVIGLAALPAFGQPSTKAPMGGMAQPAAMVPAPSSPVDQAMMAGMMKMNQDMTSAPMTGDADQDFVSMMAPHHLGAIDMARVELKYGKDPALRRMAKGIIAAQEREIAEMRRWQKLHPGPAQ